jgi:hypothetical protein
VGPARTVPGVFPVVNGKGSHAVLERVMVSKCGFAGDLHIVVCVGEMDLSPTISR